MKTVWYIAKKDLLETLKDRNSFILLLIVPLILILTVGAAFGGLFNSGSSQIDVTVAVSNHDSGYVGKAILSALSINNSQLKITVKQYSDPAQVKQIVGNSNNNVSAGVVIPSGTTEKLIAASSNGGSTQNLVQFYSLPGSNDPGIAISQSIVTSVTNQLVTSQYAGSAAVNQVESICHQPGNHCAQSTIDPATIARIVGQASSNATGTAQVEALSAGSAPAKFNTFDLVVPGYAIMFALFGLQAAAGTILQEKEDGTFRRLLIAPIQKYALLGGKLLAQFLLTLVQLLVLFLIGYFVFHLTIGSWPAVILLLIMASFATTGLGILLVSVVKTRRQLSPIVTLVVLVTSAIGGSWWPLALEPQWMQQFAKVGVTAWAMEGLNGIMLYGKDFAAIVPDVLGLLAYGLICYIIALRLFRFQEKASVA
ncbi:MAG TPA: ABC transporter permease [Ktedonobacteraceae bacterium]|nr:ABC transporter permease [Ktedonobacteraceae bacterium]